MALYHLILSLKSIDDAWALTRVFMWTILVVPRVAVFPPDRHGNGVSSADGQKLNIGGVGITAKIHQVCINIGIRTTLETEYMHQNGRLMHQQGENYI